MICNNVLIRILCESVPFHYIMDHAEIRARAHKRRLEVYGGSFYQSVTAYLKCGNTYYEA